MIVVYTGLPGAGKSYKLAQTAVEKLYRNRKIYERTGVRRMLWSNLKFMREVEHEFKGFIEYWTDLRQLVQLKDCDVLIDEVSVYFDARQWEYMSLEARRWLAQHRKFGVEMFCTAQDFAQCDKAFRRLVSDLFYSKKLIGSPDISATRPNPKYIWGVALLRELDPTKYNEEKSKFEPISIFPQVMWISRRGTEIFDTRAEVKMSSFPPLKHIDRTCELPECEYHKTAHV